MLYRTETEDAHVNHMAPRLRRADQAEIEAFSSMTPHEGLYFSYASSRVCYTIMENETPVAMYGGVPHGHGRANVWMLATDDIVKHRIQFLRESINHLNMFHDELNSSFLYAYADLRNTLHIKWLEFTGFTFGKIVKVRDNNFITVTRLQCVA